MVASQSATSVGSGGRSPGRSSGAPRSGAGATVRQRKAVPTRSKSTPGGGSGNNSEAEKSSSN